MTGFVSIIGAGPGDPELLTLRAARRLEEADLILYDALVTHEILALGRRAKCFCVGKRGGKESMAQETIETLLVQSARRGERVVRLKCGDPFVFGRGSEEALRLREAGIPYEVVPGITSAISAPGAAGIPVTHRGISSGFLVTSGHCRKTYEPLLKTCPKNQITLVLLMGVRTASDIAAFLLEQGWSKTTAAAIIFGAWTSQQSAWSGTLESLVQHPSALNGEATYFDSPGKDRLPGTLIIGDVVRLARHDQNSIRWLTEESPHPAPQRASQRR